MTKTYLGDSVYADVEYGLLKLTTENGDPAPSNTILLEPEVLFALEKYITQLKLERDKSGPRA